MHASDSLVFVNCKVQSPCTLQLTKTFGYKQPASYSLLLLLVLLWNDFAPHSYLLITLYSTLIIQVAIPCLHVSLGSFPNLLHMYEVHDCHHLDLLLTTEKAEQGASYDSGSFGQCVAAV